jgi:hypothetical protein
MAENATEPTPLFCYRHPDRETMLRCARCERPICSDCAVLTPTGYRCKECIRGQQKVFETARTIDYPLAFVLAGGLSFGGSLVAGVMGFFTIFIAPLAGLVIAEVVRWAVRRRRSRRLFQVAAIGAAAGAFPLLAINLIRAFAALAAGAGIGGLWGLLWVAVYAFMVVSTSYYRLSGIQLR